MKITEKIIEYVYTFLVFITLNLVGMVITYQICNWLVPDFAILIVFLSLVVVSVNLFLTMIIVDYTFDNNWELNDYGLSSYELDDFENF